MNSPLQEESVKFERVSGMERTIMKRFVLTELGTLVLGSAGTAERVPEVDAVLFDIYGYTDVMKRLGKCYRYAQAAKILEETGVGELFALCNTPQLFSTIKELVDIRCRLKEIQKINRKQGKSSLRKDEQEYLTEMYKSATKVFRKKLGLKKSPKYRYKTRYGGISALLENNETKGWGIFDDDEYLYDDDDDFGFNSADFSNYARFAKKCGYKTGINKIVGGSVPSRGRNRYEEDDDEEEYDLYERPRRKSVKKSSNLSLYADDDFDDEDDEDEYEDKKDSKWKNSIEGKIDQLTDALQTVIVKDRFRHPNENPASRFDPLYIEPQDPNDPNRQIEMLRGKIDQMDMLLRGQTPIQQQGDPNTLQGQVQALSQMVNKLIQSQTAPNFGYQELRKGPKMMPSEPYSDPYSEDMKIRRSQSIVNDDDDGMEDYSPEEKARMLHFAPVNFAEPEDSDDDVEREFQRRLQERSTGRPQPKMKNMSHPTVYTNRMTERDLYEEEEDDGDNDEPLTMEEIEILSARLSTQEVQMLMRSELTEDEQAIMVQNHPELSMQGVSEVAADITAADPVPGEPEEEPATPPTI